MDADGSNVEKLTDNLIHDEVRPGPRMAAGWPLPAGRASSKIPTSG